MDTFDAHALNAPSRPAVIEGATRFSWAQWAEMVRRAGNAFASLVSPGERALLVSGNSWQMLVASAGFTSAGAVTVPVNPSLTASELRYLIEDSLPSVVAASHAAADRVRAALAGTDIPLVVTDEARPETVSMRLLMEAAPDSPISSRAGGHMLYTSGTSGRPKGAYHIDAIGDERAAGYIDRFGLRSDDVHLVAGPLYHSAPAAFCALALSFGGTVVLMPKFDPRKALSLIETERITTTFMAPILLKRMIDLPVAELERFDLTSMRSLIVAGAHCPFPLKQKAMRYFTDSLYEFYGSTETKAVLSIGPEDQLRKPGSCGTPMPGVRVRLVTEEGHPVPRGQPGEVMVSKESSTFTGYFRDEAKTRATIRDGWIATGDVAYEDDEGFFYIVDRREDLVISGGVNIYPAEVELALREHAGVEEAAVFGIPDEEWGERLHAIVKPSGEVSTKELEDFLRTRIAGFKIPRSWEFSGDLTRTDDGKLRKRALRPKD